MDLKINNLLLNEEFDLVISDFEFSYMTGDIMTLGRGTKNFRAPEIILNKCDDPKIADLYSLGILLYTMKAGQVPANEQPSQTGNNLFAMVLHDNKQDFWDV